MCEEGRLAEAACSSGQREISQPAHDKQSVSQENK